MHAHLESAAEALGLVGHLPSLEAASTLSDLKIDECRSSLRKAFPEGDGFSDVVAFGSLARREFTLESDFDYLVISHAFDPRPRGPGTLLDAADSLRWSLGADPSGASEKAAPAPGGTQIFGVVISASDVTERIGLQADTNHDQTRRLLVLEESVSLLHPDKHAVLVRSIVDRYLAHYEQGAKPGVPRFLLNDVIRYWRTLTVDYQAKAAGSAARAWGLRYLKLIVSRKLAYAGTLVPLLMSSDVRPAGAERLYEDFMTPPLARLGWLHHVLDEDETREALRTALLIAEEFVTKSGDSGWRRAVKEVESLGTADSNAAFSAMQGRARELQRCLQTIFFQSEALRENSLKYLAF